MALLVLLSFRYDFLSDDAFITMRYARNLNDGLGLVYNQGEAVEGYTSTLWVLLLTALGRLGADYVLGSRALSLVFSVGTTIFTYLVARRTLPERPLLSALPPILASINSAVGVWSLAGMEVTAFACLIMLALYLLLSTRRTMAQLLLTGLVLSTIGLTRPEGAVVVAISLVWLSMELAPNVRRILLVACPVLLIVGLSFVFRLLYFGDWLPNTFYAKVGSAPGQLVRGFGYVTAFSTDYGLAALYWAPIVIRRLRAGRQVGLIVMVFAGLTGAVILVGGDGLPMYRFMVPIVPVWAVLLGVLVRALLRATVALRYQRYVHAGVAAIVVGLVVLFVRQPLLASQYEQYLDQKENELPRWSEAGRWLAANAQPTDSIAAVPIGAVGYYSGLAVHDMVGLVDRNIARNAVAPGGKWAGHEKHDGPYVLSKRPTYLLLGNIQVLDERLPADSPDFVRPSVPFVRLREDDMFSPELYELYEPRVVQLPSGWYFHFLQLRGSP